MPRRGLILTRKEGEELYIVDTTHVGITPIKVGVESIRGDRVRLAFDASDRYTIYRTELVEKNHAGIYQKLRTGEPLTAEDLRELDQFDAR